MMLQICLKQSKEPGDIDLVILDAINNFLSQIENRVLVWLH